MKEVNCTRLKSGSVEFVDVFSRNIRPELSNLDGSTQNDFRILFHLQTCSYTQSRRAQFYRNLYDINGHKRTFINCTYLPFFIDMGSIILSLIVKLFG